jgi:hypothetical protein
MTSGDWSEDYLNQVIKEVLDSSSIIYKTIPLRGGILGIGTFGDNNTHSYKEESEMEKLLHPKQIIFNGKNTVVFWQDGTRTVSYCGESDKFSEDAGVATCYMKKLFGDYSKFVDLVKTAYHQPERVAKSKTNKSK